MIRGTTQSGFEFIIEDSALNDWELVEYLDELDENPICMVKVAKKLLGDDTYKSLKKHCTVNGKVLFNRMTTEITEMLNSNKETKN